MADTSQQQQEAPEPPQTNGAVDGLTEEEKSKMRPADIDADMREMERRKRVEMMMNSRLFREELERIIETQMKDGAGPSGLLQQISEMMGPQGARFNANVFRNSNCVVPINDIRGVESMGYAKGEKLLRCKLAAVFRLLDLYGWTQGVGGVITARLNQDQEHFLVNPYGLLYHETTASSLVKADMQGGIVEQGTTNFGVHIASYQLHSTIHAARPDIKCIVHIATPSVTAISATKCGILPLGQESIVIGEVSTHHYISGANLDPEEREKLARNFGPINKVMLLTNRGALCCGETVEEAFYNVYNTVLACETQLKLMPLGVDNLNLISDETRKAIYEASRKAPVPQQSSVAEPSPLAEKLEKRWRIGGTEFEALMRMLDNAGFRTGYIYRHPLVKSEPPRPRNDVEVPPAVSSLGYLLEEEELYKQGLWKGGRKGTDRTRWLNSPNVYQKVEILETGTPDPKKITKWVSDGSPTHSSTPVKIDGALQFVPKNTNPKEFKQLQQQIKDYRRADKISAGPQSHILEGVTWEEAKKMQDATISGTGEQVVLVGAASKGIIQRGFQHNAMVYKTPYAKNPFDAVTDQELDQYKKEIERKTKGDPYDESQSESEALSSFNISRATHESSTAKSPIQSPVSVTSETEEESRDEPKVLRIETKQVPAPSQPEVVLSDEQSVKILVAGNSVARQEDVNSEHSKAQRATNVRSVNADFLNEQRRSEMLTRRNANGRGVSGVSRLSSSRSISSNSINEHICLWAENYQPCYIETARVEKLAQPMKAFITDVQNLSKIKRKMKKREFFENYEKRFKNNAYMHVKNESEDNTIDSISNIDISEDNNTLCKTRDQSQGKINEKELVRDIQYSKIADISFAEKIHLPVECKMMERNIYNLDYEQNQNVLHSSPGAQISMSNNNEFADAKIYDNHEKPNIRSTRRTATLSQDIIYNRSSFETKAAICNSHYDNSYQVTNYVNELECFVNNDHQNTVQSTEVIDDSFRSNERSIDEFPEAVFYPITELQMKSNDTEEHQFNFIGSKENSLDSTLKASSNETDYHENKQDLNESNANECLCGMDPYCCEHVNRYVNELEVSVYHYSDDSSNEEQQKDSKQKLVVMGNGDCENNNGPINNAINSKFIQVEIINSLDDRYSSDETNYVNEIEFLVCDHSNFLESDITVDHITEDPLKLSSKNKTSANNTRQETDYMEKVDLATDKDILETLQFNEKQVSEVNSMPEKELVYNHSTPLDGDDTEKNPLDVSLNIFLASETNSVSEESLGNITVKEEDISNLSMVSYEKKSAENRNLWVTIINNSCNFIEDTPDQSREIFKSIPNCLDFTYSEIDKYSEDDSPASITHCSFFSDDDLVVNRNARRDSIAEVVSSINVDMKPSNKLTVDTLAETENSVKYNLDSQNMSLIYSITPPNDIGDSSKDTTITEDILEDNEEEYEAFDNDADNEDVNLINPLNNTDKKEIVNMNKTTELSDASFISNFSNQGSDLLELPSHTYFDLQKSSDEIFHKNMSTSVNQILTELNDAEVFVTAENFVNQLVDYVACLDLTLNTTIYSKEELNNFIRKKVSSLNFARKLAKDLVGNLPCYDANNSTNSKVSNTDESSRLESLDQNIYVIREIIHHVVDRNNLGRSDFKSKKTVTDKKVKESMNIELKGLKDEYDVEDEQSLKCSTPKTLLSPRMSKNSSFSEEHILMNLEHDTDHDTNEGNVTASSKSHQSSDAAVSSHSSPSTESQNFAEQEVTSESTDNDTKSDNSKEKPTDSRNIQKNQCISANLHLNSIIDTNHQVISEEQKCQNLSNKISFCVIECLNEENLNLGQDLQNDIQIDIKDNDTDSDESIRDFMERFMNCQEEINQMWQTSEERLDRIYAIERLGEISNLKKGIMVCQENIRELHQKIEIEAASIFSSLTEESTSFICNENDLDDTTKTLVRFERVDKNCTCCCSTDETVVLENTTTQILSPISEEPDLESLEAAESQAVNPFDTLPSLFDEPEFYSAYDNILDGESDSRTVEFYSCQNSTSTKSFGDTEFTDSTFTISAEEITNSEKAYSADMSTNNNTVSGSSTIYPSETDISGVNSISLHANITENLADISSNSSQAENNEVVIESMTYSYDTKEFIKLERACSNDDSNCADSTHFNSLLSNHVV